MGYTYLTLGVVCYTLSYLGVVCYTSYLGGSVLHTYYLGGSVLHTSYLGGSRVETLWSGARGVVTQAFAWAEGVTGTGHGVHSCVSRTRCLTRVVQRAVLIASTVRGQDLNLGRRGQLFTWTVIVLFWLPPQAGDKI